MKVMRVGPLAGPSTTPPGGPGGVTTGEGLVFGPRPPHAIGQKSRARATAGRQRTELILVMSWDIGLSSDVSAASDVPRAPAAVAQRMFRDADAPRAIQTRRLPPRERIVPLA